MTLVSLLKAFKGNRNKIFTVLDVLDSPQKLSVFQKVFRFILGFLYDNLNPLAWIGVLQDRDKLRGKLVCIERISRIHTSIISRKNDFIKHASFNEGILPYKKTCGTMGNNECEGIGVHGILH